MNVTISRRALVAAVLAGVGAARADAPVRLRGAIEAVDGDAVTIRARDGAVHTLVLAGDAAVIAIEKRVLADIRPGDFVGCGAVPGKDGLWRAVEVHIFAESMRGTGEGHRPWELPESSMTNATVADTVTGVDGNTLTLRYKGGEQRIMVAADTPVVGYVPGERNEIRPGKAVFVANASKAADGTLRASRIAVERTAKPPM
jgi:hypothetical protein